MKIAVASGKGGTGKTTVTANLAAFLASSGIDVAACDCDVEEPNLHLFLKPKWGESKQVGVPVPMVDEQACAGDECGICVEQCRFKSLIMMAGEVMVFPELCHGCGLCSLACPEKAISEGSREIGIARSGGSNGIEMVGGEMRIGEAMAPPLIAAVLDSIPEADVQLVDCPPGTSCPVIKSLEGVDYAVLVTEPTPFGLNDLDLAVQVLRKLEIPFGVVINRHGMGDDRVERYLEEQGVDLLARIPHSLEAASSYSRSEMLVGNVEGFQEQYASLWQAVSRRAYGG